MKYSIIIPVYNVSNYISKCLNSVINQTYKNFEIIVICDKNTDDSETIVDEYVDKYNNIKKIYAENTGLAKAKNIGVKHANGDYVLFLDGDDYIDKNLLSNIEKETKDNPEVIRFQAREIGENTREYNEKGFATTNGIEAFSTIINYHYIENSWLYAYKISFWKANDFKFMNGCLAEDYGLTPLIIASSKRIKSIPYVGYNYVQRHDSIMNNNNYKQKLKKMDDMFLQALFLKRKINKIDNTDRFISFINNSLIYYTTTLKKEDYKKYYQILKEQKCFSHLKSQKLKTKIKNYILRKNPWFFYHHIAR